jgi:hypothetical protein
MYGIKKKETSLRLLDALTYIFYDFLSQLCFIVGLTSFIQIYDHEHM